MKSLLSINNYKAMRRAVVTLVACHVQYYVQSQNLVLNPSFEDTISCYDWYNGTFNLSLPAKNWNYSVQGSPDYYHPSYCGYNLMPNSPSGYQWARTGVAYEGFAVYQPPGINQHEFVGGQLSDSLKKGHQYCMEFYVSLANKCMYATDGIGVYFANDTILDTLQGNYFPYYFPYTPVFESPVGMPITDTLNWVLVNGSFTAKGGERFFAIGNFRDDNFTTLDSMPGASVPVAYYFIDDVSVVDCTVGVNEIPELKFTTGPNPVKDRLLITIDNYKPAESAITVTDVAGKILLHKNYSGMEKPKEIDVSGLAGGIYFITLKTKKDTWVRKFVKQ